MSGDLSPGGPTNIIGGDRAGLMACHENQQHQQHSGDPSGPGEILAVPLRSAILDYTMSSARTVSGVAPGSNMTTRSRLVLLHRWLGLTAGVIFAIAAGTGGVLVYADDLDALLGGPRFQTTPGLIGPHEIQAAVEREVPHGRVIRVIWPTNGVNIVSVRVTDGVRQRDLVLDAGTGATLDPRPPHWLLTTTRRLHAGLLMGPTGALIVQLASAAALISLAAGLCLWWPGLRRLASGFRMRLRRGAYLMNLDLHQLLGILALPLLVVMTLTGVLMNGTALSVVFRLVHGAEALNSWAALRSSPADPSSAVIDLSTAARLAQAEAAGTTLTHLAFPARPDGVIEARLVGTTGEARGTRLRVALDRYTGVVLMRQQVIYDGETNGRLHFGTTYGPAVRALYAASCVAGFSLLPTGAAVWWLTRRRRPAQGRKAA